jgi:hypothetical protein
MHLCIVDRYDPAADRSGVTIASGLVNEDAARPFRVVAITMHSLRGRKAVVSSDGFAAANAALTRRGLFDARGVANLHSHDCKVCLRQVA